MTAPVHHRPVHHRLERLRASSIGIATRRAFFDYIKVVALVMFILLVVAWTIDLAENFAAIRRKADETQAPLMSVLTSYLFYRAADIVTRLLTMACFFGAFFAEIQRRLKLEAVILNAAGATPLQMMAGMLWVALLLGTLQAGLESRWRPAAIWAQVDLGVGTYAGRYEQSWFSSPSWIVTDDIAIRGTVRRAEDPAMRDLMLFVGIGKPNLDHIYRADRMEPSDKLFHWRLSGVTAWSEGQTTGEPVPDLTLKIDLIPQMLSYFKVPEFNLPGHALAAFSALPSHVPQPGADTAVWRRRTAWLLPGAFLFLGISLAQRGFEGRKAMIPRLIGLAAFGYILVVSVKVFWEMSEKGILAAGIATTAGIAVAILAGLVTNWRNL